MQIAIDFNQAQSSILGGLNNQQIEAVTHKSGPLLVIAGAGTGKTTVITRRIAYIIEQQWAKPSEILALTFTEKAAQEMEERVDLLVPYGCTDMWISTFHAFGDRILRDYAIELGLPANFKILTGTEQAIFMRHHLYTFELKHYRPLSNPTTHIEALLNHFSRLKDELISPEAYLTFAQSKTDAAVDENEIIEAEKTSELAKAYQHYQQLMLTSGNLDFGDLIYLSHHLLKTNRAVLKECRERFRYILVDEYQDTNYAQNEIVKLLAHNERNITVVGDDDQSIYRFRGASISNILDFKDSYPDTKEVILNSNYRSTQEILDTAYTLIQHNNPDRLEVKNNIDKRLISPKRGQVPEILVLDTLSSEADAVIKTIQEIKQRDALRYRDFAILVRANSHAEPFIQACNVAGVPYIFSGADSLFKQPEIKMLIALVKSLAYNDDNLSFYQLAVSELYCISPNTLAEIFSQAKRSHRPVYSIIEYRILTGSDCNERIVTLYNDIKTYRDKINQLNVGELLYDYLTQQQYLKRIASDQTVENELKIKHIAKFFELISQFNRSTEDQSLLSFLSTLEMLQEYGEESTVSDIDPDLDAVNILTTHASKGLEWEVVFIANTVSDRFPSRRKRDPIPIPEELIKERLPEGDFHLEEERRLFYVAITRARQHLFFTMANDYGGKRKKKISPFVLEALPETNPKTTPPAISHEEKISRFQKVETEIIKLPDKFQGDRLFMSRQQIDDYNTCPKKFYFAHIIQLPLLENHALIYGTAIHAALNRYFTAKMKGDSPNLQQLILDFQQAFHSLGFVSREHEKSRFEAGIQTLTRFFEEVKDDSRIPSGVEVPFEFSQPDVLINGRYDLIYQDGDIPEICDFKTSNVTTQEDANKQINESMQMKIYALAWWEKYGIIPRTTLFFIESRLKGEKIYSESELNDIKSLIHDVITGIKSNNLEAKPDFTACRWCPFKEICPDSST